MMQFELKLLVNRYHSWRAEAYRFNSPHTREYCLKAAQHNRRIIEGGWPEFEFEEHGQVKSPDKNPRLAAGRKT